MYLKGRFGLCVMELSEDKATDLLEPEPLPLGIVSFTDSGCLNDVCMGTLMGFDVEKIYLLRSAIEQIKDDENCVYWNGNHGGE